MSTSLALMMTCMLREQMAALPPSIALQQFAKHVNESADQSAIDVRSVLSQVEGLARSAFHDKAALVRHFSSNGTSVSVATLQVQNPLDDSQAEFLKSQEESGRGLPDGGEDSFTEAQAQQEFDEAMDEVQALGIGAAPAERNSGGSACTEAARQVGLCSGPCRVHL